MHTHGSLVSDVCNNSNKCVLLAIVNLFHHLWGICGYSRKLGLVSTVTVPLLVWIKGFGLHDCYRLSQSIAGLCWVFVFASCLATTLTTCMVSVHIEFPFKYTTTSDLYSAPAGDPPFFFLGVGLVSLQQGVTSLILESQGIRYGVYYTNSWCCSFTILTVSVWWSATC